MGLLGRTEVFEGLAESHTSLSDETFRLLLVRSVQKRNYIARSAEAEYGSALMREFRKFLGSSDEEEPEGAREASSQQKADWTEYGCGPSGCPV